MTRLRVGTAVAALLASACADTGTPGRGGVSRTTRGDTVVVRTTGDGVWGPIRDAVEVLKVEDDSPETTLGAAYLPVGTPDGGVVLLDSRGPNGMIVRRFDALFRWWTR